MSLVHEYREVRERLRNPPNARPDPGINMKNGWPKPKPKQEPVLEPFPFDWFERIVNEAVRERNHAHPTIKQILKAVARYYDISVADIVSQRRTLHIVRPRQVVMYMAKELTGHSLPAIGQKIGDRDHTTILHGVRKIRALRESDPILDAAVSELMAGFQQS